MSGILLIVNTNINAWISRAQWHTVLPDVETQLLYPIYYSHCNLIYSQHTIIVECKAGNYVQLSAKQVAIECKAGSY